MRIALNLLLLIALPLGAQNLRFTQYGSLQSRLFDHMQDYRLDSQVLYRPQLSATLFSQDAASIDSEVAAEFRSSLQLQHADADTHLDAELYRAWLRYSGAQYEARIGLQKINFGAALMLRPLQWFDTIDPTDPAKNSQGVYALLGRYYLLNNANFWLWLINPDEVTQSISFAHNNDGFAWGGRAQYPLPLGEAGLSYLHRGLDHPSYNTEQRLGFDWRGDIGIGIWLETSASRFSGAATHRASLTTVGGDYTIAAGNGIQITAEHMRSGEDWQLLNLWNHAKASSLMLSYPLNLLDSLSGILAYDWNRKKLQGYASFSRAYDLVTLYCNVYWAPLAAVENSMWGGKSVEIRADITF